MSAHSSGSDSRFGSYVIIIQGRERRIQTNNVHESVIWNGRKLEVTGHADGRGKHWRVWIVFWGQRDLKKRNNIYTSCSHASSGRRGGLMFSALDSGSSGPGSRPGRGHCVVFMGKTLHSHSASLHPGV